METLKLKPNLKLEKPLKKWKKPNPIVKSKMIKECKVKIKK